MNKTYVFEYKNVKVEHTLDNVKMLESFTINVDGELKKLVVNRRTSEHYIAPQRLINVVQEEFGLRPDEKNYRIGIAENITEEVAFKMKQVLKSLDRFYDLVINKPSEATIKLNSHNLDHITVL